MQFNNEDIREEYEQITGGIDPMSVDFVEGFAGSSAFICDAIMEYADANTSIYYCDIDEYAKGHPEELARAAWEFDMQMQQGDDWLTYTRRVAQTAEFLDTERVLYDDLEDICTCFLLIACDAYENGFELFGIVSEYAGSDEYERCDDAEAFAEEYAERLSEDENAGFALL